MLPGRRDRFIELRRRVLSEDSESGQKVETWPSAYAEEWAEKADLRGRDYFAAKQVNSEVTAIFRIPYRSDVSATDRLVCEGVSYSILAPTEIGRREGLELMATAIPT